MMPPEHKDRVKTFPVAAADEAIDQFRNNADDRFQALVAAAGQIVWTTRPDGAVDDLPLWRAYTGQSVDAVKGWGWLDAVHPDDRERVARVWSQAVSAHSLYETEYRIRRSDGVYHSFLVRGVPVVAPNGRIREWVGICTDIDRHKRIEEELRAREARLSLQYATTAILARETTLQDAIPSLLATIGDHLRWDVGLFWLVDTRDGVLRYRFSWHRETIDCSVFDASSRGEAFRPGTGLPGRVWAARKPSVIIDINRDTNFTRRAEALAAGLQGAVCFPILTASTVYGVLEFFSRRPGQLDDHLVQALTTLGTQIGQFIERTQTAEALRASEARTRAILDTALDAIVTMDHEGHIVEFNPAAERIFGYRREDAVGRELGALIVPPALREQHRAGLRRYLETGHGPLIGNRVEVTAMRADGTIFPAEITITRIALDGPPLFTGHIRDITERKHIEEERLILLESERSARDEAVARLKQMEEFLSIAGHELKTPLTSIIGNTQLASYRLDELLRNKEPRSVAGTTQLGYLQRLLERVHRQSGLLNRLINDLLDASRIQAGRLQLHMRSCDLAAIVRDIVQEQRQLTHGRAIIPELPDQPTVPIVADPDRIGQVITNYLSNALKYSEPDTPVVVSLFVEDGMARVSVRDQGPGIAAEEQQRIWDRFYRVEGVGHRHGSSVGLGLGLYISKTIVERHHGQVGIESVPGEGATFWFTLPLAPADRSQ